MCCRCLVSKISLCAQIESTRNSRFAPSGSRGLMLGEIFGMSAGLAMVEHVLFRFFAVRANLVSPFFPFVMENAGLVGVDAPSTIGLGRLAIEAPGVLRGPILGVFLADIRGVSWPPSRTAVSILARAGRSRDASGRVRSSIMAGGSIVSLKFGEGCMRISEAGVAGVAPCPLVCAIIAGD